MVCDEPVPDLKDARMWNENDKMVQLVTNENRVHIGSIHTAPLSMIFFRVSSVSGCHRA